MIGIAPATAAAVDINCEFAPAPCRWWVVAVTP